MKVREFARHLGVSHVAVLKGAKRGRLRDSVTRDSRGRVVDIDPVVGREEWERNGDPTRKLAATLSPRRREQGAAPVRFVVAGPAHVSEPYVAFLFNVAPFVSAAARALREKGTEPTPEALQAVLEATDTAQLVFTAYMAVHAAIEPMPSGEWLPLETIASWWEDAGAAAVLGRKGARP